MLNDGDFMNDKKMNSKIRKIIILLIIFISPLLIVCFCVMFSIMNNGLFTNNDNMHQIDIEYYNVNYSIKIPNDWIIEKKEDYYNIYDTNNNMIGFQIYKGYQEKNEYLIECWKEYELNPEFKKYDYKNISFQNISTSKNNDCYFKKNDLFYELCMIKADESNNKVYSLEFFITEKIEFDFISKIVSSYQSKFIN